MRSILDDLRDESRRDLARRTPLERIELALRLGDDDVALVCAGRAVSGQEAKRLIARSRQRGRHVSAATEPDR